MFSNNPNDSLSRIKTNFSEGQIIPIEKERNFSYKL
jgi:hypothetical protein